MCKRNSPQKSKANIGRVRETPQILKKERKKSQHGMCKRNSPQKSKANMGQ